MKKFDYGFESGAINYRNLEFVDGVWQSDQGKSMRVIDALINNHSGAIYAELSDKEIKLAKSGGLTVEYALLNHESPESNGAIIYNVGIGGNIRARQEQREAEVLATTNPDKQILLINNSGSGRSSIKYENGIYLEMGEWMLPVLADQLGKYGDKIEIWGHSAGARVAMGLAAAFGDNGQKVDGLRMIDPPSAVDRTPLGIQMKFISQVLAMMRYGKSPYNETKKLKRGGPIGSEWLSAMTGANKANLWDLPLLMRKRDELIRKMKDAMSAVRGDFVIVSPEYSEFQTPEQMRKLVGAVASEQSNALPENLKQIIVKNHSHAILSAQAGVRPQITLYEIAKQR